MIGGRAPVPRCAPPVLAVVAALATAAPRPAGAIPSISRDKIISIAKTGVGCRYVWGGTCWNPNNRTWKGADCSGYVTKCWQIPSSSRTTDCVAHYYTTYTFQNSTTHWTKISRSSLLKGDALVYNSGSHGHMVLYYSGDKWGAAQVYQAKGTAYGIVYGTKNVSSTYVARRRNGIVASAPTYPLLSIESSIASIPKQSRDFCKSGKSSGIFDWRVHQTTTVNVDVKNSGKAVGKHVDVTLWAETPYLKITKWNIYSNWKNSSFTLNDTDGMQKVSRTAPGKQFTLHLYGLSPGETKRIKLAVEATKYSIGAADHPDIRAWVSHVDNYYEKASFGSKPNNVHSYQKQNGGDLRTYSQTDVLSNEICDQKDNDCDGETDEGGVCSSDAGSSDAWTSDLGTQWPRWGIDAGSSPEPPTELAGGCALSGETPPSGPLSGGPIALLALVGLRLISSRRRERR